MKACVIVALLLTPVLGITVKVAVKSSLRFNAEEAKNRPVAKVITLLKDMATQLEKEGDEDQEVYEKTACWCKTNEKEKTKSISDAEASIEQLFSSIEERTATSARLTVEIKDGEEDVAENKVALAKATALRAKQAKEFNTEENDMTGSIAGLKDALVVMGKHSALLQGHVSDSAKDTMQKLSLSGELSDSERRAVTAFVQGSQASSGPSSEIFGTLSQMKENFETNLASAQKEEGENQKSFEELKAAKESEIKTGQDQVDSKEAQLADNNDKNAAAKQSRKDTKKSLAADEEFLAGLKETCAQTDKEMEERTKTRQEELQAVSKATEVLTSDDAKDTFGSTFKFVQTEAAMHSERRNKASDLLSEVAKKTQSPRLSALAYRVRLDAFTKVKQAIDEMVVALQKEGADEIKHKDFCVAEFNKNAAQTEKATHKKANIKSKAADLAQTKKTLTEEITQLKKEIAEDQVQLKNAGEERDAQNKDFKQTVADQRATISLLTKAVDVLNGFYAKKAAAAAASLVEVDDDEIAAPKGFKSYKTNDSANGVTAMIQQIIADAKTMEAEALHAEKSAVSAYAKFAEENNASVATKNKSVVNKSSTMATAEGDLVEAVKNLGNTNTELTQLAASKTELHASCDYVTNNFSIRQTARAEEVQALKQAKSILSGAKFGAFLQR